MAAVVCLVTAPPDRADALAHELVQRRVAACVNVVGGVRSVYRWEGAVQRDDEALLVVKTTRATIPALDAALAELHPYETYELVALDVAAGAAPYLAWIDESVDPAGH
ncbi:MAG: divalent-cation tolerance protein CutA [Vicinamibacteria bacterium]